MNLMDSDLKLDVCGLEPPEPLERVLAALSTLRDDQRLCMLIDRQPYPLYSILERNGFAHQTRIFPDSLVEILIWRGR